MKHPKISIITAVFNGEEFLEETIKSVINQTYENIEYIIIDGGSTDGTVDIIKKYEKNISYWVSEPDKGIYDAMNKGIDTASGDWINFMNAGDSFYNLNILKEGFEKKDYLNIDIIYGNVKTDYGEFSKVHKAGKLNNLLKGMQFSHQSCFFNLKYHKIHKYNLDFKLSSDFLNILSLYLQDKSKLFYIDIPISIVNTDGVSEKNIINSVLERWKAVKLNNKSNLKITIFYILHIIKQYIKINFLNENILLIFRKIKFRK